MPIVLPPPARALDALTASDRQDVWGALGWLGGHEHPDEPLVLSRYALQIYLWYQLPAKLLAPVEAQIDVAAALGRFLDAFGEPARPYAALCRAEETVEALRAWDLGFGRGRTVLRRLLDTSAIEPPDTPMLSWGSVSGLEEARLHREAALALELALEVGELRPSEPGVRRRQTAVLERFLGEASDDLEGRTPVEAIHAERLASWARGRSEEHRSLVEPVVPILRDPGPALATEEVEVALAPLLWLLEQAEDGLPLTQTGALGRAVVRAAVKHFPDWWNSELHGPPHQEAEVVLLLELHAFARRARLLRRRGRRLLLTPAGRKVRARPTEAATVLASALLLGQTFDATVQELACATLLGRARTTQQELNDAVRPVVVAGGWQSLGQPPGPAEVDWPLRELLALGNALGLVRRERERFTSTFALTDVGRAIVIHALRARARAEGPRQS